jgi:hypothetical protein
MEISAGYNRNTYYDLEEESPHYSSDYSGGNGYAVKLSVERFRLLDSILPIRLEINYTNYKGHAEIRTGGQSYGITEITDIDKSVLGFGIYPLMFRIKKNFRIDIGLEVDFLLNDNSTGYYKSWGIGNPGKSGEISDFENSSPIFAVLFQTGYEFALKNNWSVYPRYHLYVGITDDFGNTHSLRNQFEVGLIRKIK